MGIKAAKRSCVIGLQKGRDQRAAVHPLSTTQALSQIRDLGIPGKLPNILSRRMRRHIRIHWNVICFLGHSKALSLLIVWSVWSPSKFNVSRHIRECLFLLCFTYHKCGLAACKKMSRKTSLFPLDTNFLMLERDFAFKVCISTLGEELHIELTWSGNIFKILTWWTSKVIVTNPPGFEPQVQGLALDRELDFFSLMFSSSCTILTHV